jgi:hypothetical protein
MRLNKIFCIKTTKAQYYWKRTARKVQASSQEHLTFVIFLKDQIELGNVEVQYCPTGEMTSDYMSKPLQGKLFRKFKNEIMGSESSESPASSVSSRSALEYKLKDDPTDTLSTNSKMVLF